jgi:hypothetical protein
MFDEEEGFDCPVRFWGYYWLSETPAVAGLAWMPCGSAGTITINGLDHASNLTARPAAVLCKAWMREKALGKAKRLILQYEMPLGRRESPRMHIWLMSGYSRSVPLGRPSTAAVYSTPSRLRAHPEGTGLSSLCAHRVGG